MSRILRNSLMRGLAVLSGAALLTAAIASAQDYAAPAFTPAQMDSLVSRIALYPDPLLAQVLAASTFPDQIQSAAQWADANRNLSGPDLPAAIANANLPYDPSVQALLPFPSVLDMMASDMNWTAELGNAVLAQRADVMDAVQRMRQLAWQYGYLADNTEQQVLDDQGDIEILPVNPDVIYVPVYDSYVVYCAPAPGFVVSTAIRFPFRWQRNAVRLASTPANPKSASNYARPGINPMPVTQPQITPQRNYNVVAHNTPTYNPANRPAQRPAFDRPAAQAPAVMHAPAVVHAPAMSQRPAAPPRVEQRAQVSQARQSAPAPRASSGGGGGQRENVTRRSR